MFVRVVETRGRLLKPESIRDSMAKEGNSNRCAVGTEPKGSSSAREKLGGEFGEAGETGSCRSRR